VQINQDMRPAPEILLVHQTRARYDEITRLPSSTMYSVTLNGEPIRILRTTRTGIDYPHTVYADRGRAERLAAKLNEQHKTDGFGVVPLVPTASE
jgi:hypothetical protein